jgi:hypothetical protein
VMRSMIQSIGASSHGYTSQYDVVANHDALAEASPGRSAARGW